MTQNEPKVLGPDDVQIFDIGEALKISTETNHRVDMAKSPASYIALFRVPPRGGETRMHQHPDSDQILFILQGECTVQGVSSRYVLYPNQGVLIPAGVYYGFTNTAKEDLIFLSMRPEASGGRRVAYVPEGPPLVDIVVPKALADSRGLGPHVYFYALDRETIGVSFQQIQEWNLACLLRVHSTYEVQGDSLVAKLPERIARWYKLTGLEADDYRLLPEPGNERVRMDISPLVQREAREAALAV